MNHCKNAFEHEPDETCSVCGLEVDRYGNTSEDFLHCSFPHCGCDGAQHCMAGEASDTANKFNKEGMYRRTDKEAVEAKLGLVGLCLDRDKALAKVKAKGWM